MKHGPLAMLAALALAGCNIALEDDYDPDPRLSDASALFTRLVNEPTTRPADMPVTGSGRYEGFAVLDTTIDGREGFALGDAEITARFGDGPTGVFAGTVTNLVDGDSAPLPGALAFSGTSSGATLSGDLAGDIVVDDETLSVDGVLLGVYGGRSATSFFADTAGTFDDGASARGRFDGHIFGD